MNTFPCALAFKVKGSVDHIYGANEAPWYMSDPETKKKCIERDGGTWFCKKLNKAIQKPKCRFILNCRVKDHTGSQVVTVFDNQSAPMLGHTADELFDMHMLGHHTRVELIYKKAIFTEYYLSKRVKMETYNNEARQKIVLTAMTPLNHDSECAELTTAIATFQ
jgi:hypothetical protein